MIKRPDDFGRFEFAVLSSLRAAQLSRGCLPLVTVGLHKLATTAQMEVAERKVVRSPHVPTEAFPVDIALAVVAPLA